MMLPEKTSRQHHFNHTGMKTLKYIFFGCCLLLFYLTAFDVHAQVQKSRFEINGSLHPGAVAPSKLYLFLGQKLADSALVQKGGYHFSGNVGGTEHALIKAAKSYSIDKHRGIPFLVTKGVVNIVSDASLKNVVLSGPGSQAAKDYREAIKSTLLLTDSISDIMAGKAYQENSDLRSATRIRMAFIAAPMAKQMTTYLKAHPQSPASGYILSAVAESTYPSVEIMGELLKTLPADQQLLAKNKFAAFKQKKEAEALAKQKAAEDEARAKQALEDETAIGKKALDFTQADTAGRPVTLSSYKGKYVLVDFWASWCHPCRAENPSVLRTFNAYKGKGFTVLGISLDGGGLGSRRSWVAAIKEDGLNWTQLSDLKGAKNEVAMLYHVTAIPRNFLIDPNGVIIAKDLRGEALEKKVAAIFE